MGLESGGLDKATKLVQAALGRDASAAVEQLRYSIEDAPFSFLRDIDSQNLLTFLIDERPQTIALVVSHLPASKAAAILAGLQPDRQLAVIHRIASMEQTNPEIIEEVEQGLSRRMSNVMNHHFNEAGGVPKAAENPQRRRPGDRAFPYGRGCRRKTRSSSKRFAA